MTLDLSRRAFLAGTAAAGAVLAVGFRPDGALAAGELVANPFVTVDADGVVTVLVKHFEMGQGSTTGLATLVAEEMNADWEQVRSAFAPSDNEKYKNLLFGSQGTGGSTAIANSYEQYRKAGAEAALRLRRAAAEAWGVDVATVAIEASVLKEVGGSRTAGFGEMAGRAAALPATGEPTLKDPKDFTLIGREDLRRKDSAAKTDGSAIFAMDVRVEGMIRAVIARPPRFGGTVASVNDSAARQVKGVLDVKVTPSGVVVYATETWPAIKGREALEIEWSFEKADNRGTDALMQAHVDALDEDGHVAREEGDVAAGFAKAAKRVSADFAFPLLAHAPLEPLNCVVQFKDGAVKVWDGCQFPGLTHPTLAQIFGVPPEKVAIETVYAGGSFGRRATPTSDYHAEAAFAVKALEGTELAERPVQLVWTREDDVKGGYFRPMYAQRIEAGIDENGKPIAWSHKLAGKSILMGTFFEQFMVKNNVDATSVEGGSTLPYAIPNMKVDVRNMEYAAPVLWWRAVGHTHTAYSTEIAIDMLAEAAGQDPVAFRLALLEGRPRHAGALKLAAEKAGWGAPAEGRFQGVAVHESFSSYVAEIAEVSLNADGAVKLERVVCAVDCGRAINPDVIRAQMEGGVGYGLSAIMRNKITMTEGAVDQTNYWDYELLRLNEMPAVEVHIVESEAAPTGVGEPGLPPVGPALANAIYAATGTRVTSLPMTDAGVRFA